jgi:hypothetical protein
VPSPDLIAPDRVEELLGGAVPEGEREALVQGLARELRLGGAPAPASLRTRVTALGDEPPRRRASLPRRRLALALALVLVAVAGIGAGSPCVATARRTRRPRLRSRPRRI